jgi:hypothetical protein
VDAFEDLTPDVSELDFKLSQQKSNQAAVTIFKGVKITFYQ